MHHIRRQRWQLKTNDRTAAFALRSGLRRDLDELNAAFDRGFSAVDDGDHVIHIPKLILNLRVNNLDELCKQLPAVLAEELGQILLQQGEKETQNFRRTSKTMQVHQLLLCYLQTGNLDWPELNFDAPSLSEKIKSAAQTWLAPADCNWSAVRSAMPRNIEVAVFFFQRLLSLLSSQTQNRLMDAALNGLSQGPAPDFARYTAIQALYELPNLMQPATLNSHQQLYVQAMELLCLAAEKTPDIDTLLPMMRRELGLPTKLIERMALAGSSQSNPAHGDLKLESSATLENTQPSVDLDAVTATTEPATRDSAEENKTEALIADLLRQEQSEQETAPGLRVHSAGLILLHHYLTYLFDACKIERLPDERIAAQSLSRAAALLHWLACGREEIYEFELGMIKPLLGLHPHDPLAVTAGLLTTADHEECEALLSAVISHWPSLGSTSLEGFRISFLQRQGLLHELEKSWQLQLESEAFDVLLAHLPWGISLIKLPWMTKPIFTDWPTR